MKNRTIIGGCVLAIYVFMFALILAWTQTRSVNPVKLEKNVPKVTFLKPAGKSTQPKRTHSGQASAPLLLTRSERSSAIALARAAGNVQGGSLEADPRVAVVLTPSAPVSGQSRFEIWLGSLWFSYFDPIDNRITPMAALSGDPESGFHFVLDVVPGKTYLADFHVSGHEGPWRISGGGAVSEVESGNRHLLVGFRAEHEFLSITIRKPNHYHGAMALDGPAFYRLELTRID